MIEVEIDNARKVEYYARGYWSEKTLLDVWEGQVLSWPCRSYVVDEQGRAFTYGEIDELADRLAAYLQDSGVGEGDVVTFQIPVWVEFAVTLVACLKIGAVMHPVSLSFNQRDLEYIMNQVESTALICPTRTRKGDFETQAFALQGVVPSLKSIVVIERDQPAETAAVTYESVVSVAKRPGTRPARTSADHVALVLSTSGTTGSPKAVLLTHNNLLFSERAFTEELSVGENDVMFMPAPLNHATGFNHGLLAPMITGGRVVLQEKFDAAEAIGIMEREGVTWSMGATPFIHDMIKCMEADGGKAPASLRFYLCGGAPVPSPMVKRAAALGFIVCEVYGSTESCPHACVPPSMALCWNGRFSGRALPGIEVKVVDDSHCEVEPGQLGEEASRGPHLFVGYLKDPRATAAAVDADGWFYSGDLCVIDEQGRISIKGRKKDIIIRGGKNISAVEIDNLMSGYPGVLDYATVGYPDERLGETICLAVVVARPGDIPAVEEVSAFLAAKGVHKRLWPERIVRVEVIPRTESGKVKRSELTKAVATIQGQGE